MREGYKKTEVGVIPEDWEVKKLEEVCNVKGGKRLPKGYQLLDEKTKNPYIRVADMYEGGINLKNIKYVPHEAADKIKNYKISKDDLFISVAGTLGIVGTIPPVLDDANLTENADKLCNIKINKEFLMRVLQSTSIQNIIEAEKTSNAQPKLALSRIKEFIIPVPSREEQEKIAEILSTVDSQIDNTENLIEKSKELKKGLMQKLLTKGIGHSEFKNTEVGEIPVSWEVKKLSELTNKITDGSHSSPIPVDDSNYKICTVANMRKNTLDISSATNISKEDYEKLINNGCYAENGDVLLSKDGTIGKTILYSQENEKIVLLSSIAILKPMKEKLRGEYLNQYLQDSRTLTRIVNTKTGSAIKRIVLRDINSLKIVVPKLKEQEKIAKILLAVDNEIEEYENKKQRLEYLKKGLMQQLLTGKIRTII